MPEITESRVETIERFLRDELAETELPGVSLAITDADELVYANGFGSRDLANNDPATAETIYGMGSVSKSFCALATAMLVEEGALAFEDPITDHLDVDLPERITIHDLLSHTSGVPSMASSEALIARQLDRGEAGVPLGSRDDFLAHVEGAVAELETRPDDRWMYCNAGYNLVGEVIAAVTGRSYVDFVSQEVLHPLGMARSTYHRDVFEADGDRMTPYFPDEDGNEPTSVPIRELSAPAGGLLAPVTDMTAYLRLHLNGGTLGDTELVDGDVLARCYEPHAETPDGPYGYGWRTRSVAGGQLIGHGGSIAVSTAYIGFDPDAELGIALGANGSPGYGLATLGEAVYTALAGEEPDATPFFDRRERLEDLCGEYESHRGIKTGTVERRGGVLELTLSDPIGDADPMVCIPESLDGPDAREFAVLATSGTRHPVEFVREDGAWTLYYDRWRLRPA